MIQPEYQQTPGVQLIVCEGNTVGGAGTGKNHEVLGANIGSEDGRPDNKPPQVAAGEEVLFGGIACLFLTAPGDTGYYGEIKQDDHPIKGWLNNSAYGNWF